MIKLFRKIRQRMLTERKFAKYLLYAIGEIILVVIGILIALSINNKNEARKTKEFEFKTLEDINTAMEGNFFQLDMCLESNKSSIKSADIILEFLNGNLTYHDSLDFHFSKSLEWCTPTFQNSGYESLKSSGMNLISNQIIREDLIIYEAGWMETLAQRQEDYFFNTAAPILTELFDKVAMRSEMKPFDLDKLRVSKKYRSVLKTSKAYREDQIYWHLEWEKGLKNLYDLVNTELEKQ